MVQSLAYEAFCLPFLLPPQPPLEVISSFPAVEFSLCSWISLLALISSIYMPV